MKNKDNKKKVKELDKALEGFLDARKKLSKEFNDFKKEYHKKLEIINKKIEHRSKEIAGKNIRKFMKR